MRRIKIILLAAFVLLSGALAWAQEQDPLKGLLVLCYHDVPKAVDLDTFGVDRAAFVQQIEYLRTHGYHFVSLDEVIKADKKLGSLPDKPVLLTFDDAYLSFYEFVFPLLKLYGYPCVLSVITSWVDSPPKDLRQPLMNWEQLKEVAKSNLVEIATHTHQLHKAVAYNAAGNTSVASSSRIYDPKTKTYETDEEFARRIHDDLKISREILRKTLGIEPRGVTWPYGEYNQIGADEAKKLWFEVMLALDVRYRRPEDLLTIGRSLIIKNPSIREFIADLQRNFQDRVQLRVLHADLDLLYDDDPVQREKNLDAFLERVKEMRVTTVFLQAFCDEQGTGNVKSVYFPNRLLPVRADFFSRVANQLLIRGTEVYAWMPTLAVVLPDAKEDAQLSQLAILYADLAANCRFSGVVFNDDAYLGEDAGLSPAGRTALLIDLIERLKTAVRRYRPNCRFARILYADALLSPSAETRFAQSFEKSLPVYDYVVIMAYPLMEKAGNPTKWFKALVEAAKKYPDGLNKTIFKVQTYDWKKREWLETGQVLKWLRILTASGAQHIGYYPDSCLLDRPQARVIRRIMSVEDFPFKRKFTAADFLK
ncbi:MAG: poly-beta-1,6-N-acetyl-D-glucosamine N-deacetylase PgaB [Candidatus Omnitrophota bacterium]